MIQKLHKKLLVSCATLGPGGAARVVANLSSPLADAFDEVVIIMWKEHPIFYPNVSKAVELISIEKEIGSKSILKKMLWFRKYVKTNTPDMILSFLEPFNLRVLISTLGFGIKTIVAERNDPRVLNNGSFMDFVEKTIYRLADGILVQTPTIQSFFTGSLSKKTHIIYNPVNLREDLVGKALETEKHNRIVTIARLIPQKKLDFLIKSFAKFVKEHDSYTLTIYGEGPLHKDLLKLVEDTGLENRVFLPGPSKTIHADILDANMFTLVSDREGMSNAMIESMCLGLPCICTKVSGAIDLITDGKNGILIDIDDQDALVKSMSMLAENNEYARKLGLNAMSLYEILNKEKIYKEWVDYLIEKIK